MKRIPIVLVLGVGSLAAACGTDNSAYEGQLRAALGQAEISLADSIGVAQAEVPGSHAVRAALRVDADPVYSVAAQTTEAIRMLRVDIVSAAVLANDDGGTAGTTCEQAIGVADALAIAEDRVGGEAVAVVWDDDVHCAREIQVLTDPELMEVKVASDGRVLEVEESDEDGTGD